MGDLAFFGLSRLSSILQAVGSHRMFGTQGGLGAWEEFVLVILLQSMLTNGHQALLLP